MTSRRVYTKRQLAVLLFPVQLSLQRVTAASHVCRRLSNTIRQPCSESQLPHMSAGDSPTRSGRVWCSVLWGHCSFLLGPEACKILCVSSKSGGSVHPGLVEVLQSNPADLQSQIPWGYLISLPLSAGSPGWKAWHGAQNFHKSGSTSVLQLFSSLLAAHPLGMIFDFIVIALLLPSCCDFFFVSGRGVSFLMGSNIYGTSIVSCDFSSFTGGGECTYFPSTILNQSSSAMLFNDFFKML